MSGRLVIAGTQSGVGKTTLTVGLIAALRQRGLTVQPFKVGPDYIDPSYHTLAAGRPCRNLDTWMLPPRHVRSCFARAAGTADLALIEGVMGLYDGFGYEDESGSTAEVAKLLAAPVVLVLDAGKIARSAGAIALGYQRFDEDLPLVGFIVNRAAGERHGHGVAAAVERSTGLPVLGWLPREEGLQIPERHLGLIPTAEPGRWQDFLHVAGAAMARHLDLDRLLAMARSAMTEERQALPFADPPEFSCLANGERPVIALARDEAFTFTYEDNLDLLRAAGAEVVSFSPLRDTSLPARTAGILLCGGFPEVYAERLSANRAMHAALRAAHHQGLPFYAECGGLMYLTEAIQDGSGCTHPMVGLLPGRCVMGGRLTLGYRVARSAGHSWFLGEGEEVRGHEFHYSAWHDRPVDLPPAYFLLPRSGGAEARPEGARVGNLWASYVHVHFGAMPELACRFVEACRQRSVEVGGCAPEAAGQCDREVEQSLFPAPRDEVHGVQPGVHGSLNLGELQELGLCPEDVLDFSANINPYGPSPAVRAAVARVPLDLYPDRECLKLTAVLADSLGVAPTRILPGNGASELIWLTALAFVRPGSRVLVLGPTFCEYARAASLLGACVTNWRSREETNFVPELKEITEHLESLRLQLVFLCNPNNPTGTVLPSETITAWAQQHPRTLFVVDEAYLPFANGLGSALRSRERIGERGVSTPCWADNRGLTPPARTILSQPLSLAEENVLVLRSMTKDFGLAGLRLGYAVGDERVIGLLRQVQPPWSVNALAQAAGVAALRDSSYRQSSLERLARAKQDLGVGLARLGLMPVPSAAHFFLVRVGDGAAFRMMLLRRGSCLVRDCASFGLPAHIRIAARRPEENDRLLTVVREVVHAG